MCARAKVSKHCYEFSFPKLSYNLMKWSNVQTLRKNVLKQRKVHRVRALKSTLELDCDDSGLKLLKYVVARDAFPWLPLDHLTGKSKDECHKVLVKWLSGFSRSCLFLLTCSSLGSPVVGHPLRRRCPMLLPLTPQLASLYWAWQLLFEFRGVQKNWEPLFYFS